jgi:DnaD/phage-associated family protein
MSRPQKAGVEYFPLDVENDDKLDLIEAEFGLTGFAVIVKLYQRIYKLGYFCEWNDEVALLFGKRLGTGGKAVSEIVSAAIRRSLFDEEIYRKYGVLTSRGIQKRYFEIVARRKNVEVEQRYLLVSRDLVPVNVNIMYAETQVNVNTMQTETPENAYRSTQSKVKESKVKESKVLLHERPLAAAAVETDQRPDFNTVEAYASGNLRYLSPGNMEELASFAEDFPADMLRYAVDLAVGAGKPTWNYVRGILRSWQSKGFKTIGDARNEERPAQTARSPYPAKPNPALQYEQRAHAESDYDDLYIDLSKLYGEGGDGK